MKVDVTDDAGAASAAEIHADVHAVRFVERAKRAFNTRGKLHHFGEGFGIRAGEIADVRVGNDHDVAGGIGKTIEDDEDFFAAIDDESIFIVSAGGGAAEDAFGEFVGLGLDRKSVV